MAVLSIQNSRFEAGRRNALTLLTKYGYFIDYIPYKPDSTFREEAPTTIIISTHYTVCASHIILYPPLHDVLHLDYGMKTNNTLHLQS
jgi:hypothetical protein